MAVIPTQTITRAGVVPTRHAALGGGNDQFANHGVEFVSIKNDAIGVARVVTVVVPGVHDDQPIANRTFSVGPGEEKLVGPFPRFPYNSVGGLVTLQFSSAVDVSIAVLKIG